MSERITDGMVQAYHDAWHRTAPGAPGDRTRAGLVAALTWRELEQRTEPELHPINLDPYPASVGEVADEIARYVLELEDSVARGVLHGVINQLNGEYARRNRVEQCESVCLGERCRHGRGHEGLHHADHGGAWRD